MAERPRIDVAVVMRKERIDNRWQPWRWVLAESCRNEPAFGTEPRHAAGRESEQRWLHPGLHGRTVPRRLPRATTSTPRRRRPCWFVLWRMDEEATLAAEPIARPVVVTLSYHEAGRWLDAQETCEQVPAPPEVVDWMREFAQAHYVPEPRKRAAAGELPAAGGPVRQSGERDDGEEARGGGHE